MGCLQIDVYRSIYRSIVKIELYKIARVMRIYRLKQVNQKSMLLGFVLTFVALQAPALSQEQVNGAINPTIKKISIPKINQQVELIGIDISKEWPKVSCQPHFVGAKVPAEGARCQFWMAKVPVSAVFYNAVLDHLNWSRAHRAVPSDHGDAVKVGLHDAEQFLRALRQLTGQPWVLPSSREWVAACELRKQKQLKRMDTHFAEWMRPYLPLTELNTYQDISTMPSSRFWGCTSISTPSRRYFYNRSPRIGLRLTLPVQATDQQ